MDIRTVLLKYLKNSYNHTQILNKKGKLVCLAVITGSQLKVGPILILQVKLIFAMCEKAENANNSACIK